MSYGMEEDEDTRDRRIAELTLGYWCDGAAGIPFMDCARVAEMVADGVDFYTAVEAISSGPAPLGER